MMSASDGQVMTFYSYKGGTGRSMALAHTAWILATQGTRVLVIDWDLEAPGLHRYFGPFLPDPQLRLREGLIDFLLNYCDAATTPANDAEAANDTRWIDSYAEIWRYAQSVALPDIGSGGKLDLVGAGRQDDLYGRRVSLFDWHRFYRVLGGGAFLNRMRDLCVLAKPSGLGGADFVTPPLYDYVLIDSRTGLSDTAGICTAQLPHKLVCLYTYNIQSIEGASQVAASALRDRAEMDHELAQQRSNAGEAADQAKVPLQVFPVGSRADDNDPTLLSLMREFAASRFRDLAWQLTPSDMQAYWVDVELPYKFHLAYHEVLAVLDVAADPKSYLATIYRLVARLTAERGTWPTTSMPIAMARATWEQYRNAVGVLSGADQKSARDSPSQPITGEYPDPLQDLLTRQTDAGRELIRRVLMRLLVVPTGKDESQKQRFAPVPLSDLRRQERDIAMQLVGEKILCLRFDAAIEQRVALPFNEDGLRESTVIRRWAVEHSEFLTWRSRLQAAFHAWAETGTEIQERDREIIWETGLPLENRYWDDLSPTEQRVWRIAKERVVRDRKNVEAQKALEAKLAAVTRTQQTESRFIQKLTQRNALYAVGAVVLASLGAAGFSYVLYLDHRRTEELLKRNVANNEQSITALNQQLAEVTEANQRMTRQSALSRAWASYNEGKTEAALEQFSALAASDEKDSQPFVGKSFVEAKMGDFGNAADDLERAIQLQDSAARRVDPMNYYYLGTYYQAANQPDKAISSLETYINAASAVGAAEAEKVELGNARRLVADLKKGGPTRKPSVTIYLDERADKNVISTLVRTLVQAGYTVRQEQRASSQRADVLYLNRSDEKNATEVRDIAQKILRRYGVATDLTLVSPGSNVPDAPRGNIELWLPPIELAKQSDATGPAAQAPNSAPALPHSTQKRDDVEDLKLSAPRGYEPDVHDAVPRQQMQQPLSGGVNRR
jgi:hypothetical protein